MKNKTIKNDHMLESGDVLQDKFDCYLVIKAMKKSVKLRPVSVKDYDFSFTEEKNCFHDKDFTKKVHCFDAAPTKKSYFVEALGSYSMSPSAYFMDTKENIIQQFKEEKEAEELKHKEQEKQNKIYKLEQEAKEKEKEQIKAECIDQKSFDKVYYGIESIENKVEADKLVKVRFPSLNKNNTIKENNKEIEAASSVTTCIIMASVKLSNDRLFNELLTDNDIYSKTGGSTVYKGAYPVTMVTEFIYNNRKYYVNTEGYNYARYFGNYESDFTFEELEATQPFQHYIKTAITKAIDLMESVSNNPVTQDHFIKLVLNDPQVKSIIKMYGYDLIDKKALENELKIYYKKIRFNVYSNKENVQILDFSASYIR